MKNIYFKIRSKLGKETSITKDYWNFIVREKHPIIKGKEILVKEALANPAQVKSSQKDSNVVLYYHNFEDKYICVVVRHQDGTGFIITAYITDKIKKGKKVWER